MDPFQKSESTVVDEKSITYQIQSAGVESDTAVALTKAFEPFERQAKEWAQTALALVVTDSSQTAEMKQAREARLAMRQIRLDIEKTHKTLKADSLKKGQLLDLIKRTLTGFVEPIEAHLQLQEDFVKLQEERQRKELYEVRVASLSRFMAEAEVRQLPLGDMPEESFNNFLEGTEAAYNRRQKQAQEEQERLRREAEEKADADRKLREENDRLKKAQEENNKRIKLMQDRISAIQQSGGTIKGDVVRIDSIDLNNPESLEFQTSALIDLSSEDFDKLAVAFITIDANNRDIKKKERQRELKKQEEAEAKLKKERAEKQKLEREQREREDKEEGERKAKAAADRKAKRAPDKVKLLAFADRIELLEAVVNLKDEEAQEIFNNAIGMLAKVVNYVKTQSENL